MTALAPARTEAAPRKSKLTFGGRKVYPLTEVLLGISVLIGLIPIAWMIILAFQDGRDIINSTWSFSFTLDNFAQLFRPGEPFIAQLVNSVLIVAGTVVLCLVVGALAGYALSQLALPRWLTFTMLALSAFLTIIPPMTLVPGLYITLSGLQLLGSITGLIMLNVVFQLPFATLLLKVYFDGVPMSLREAALVDGASESRTFVSVMLPLVRPGMAAVAVFTGIMAWNEFLFGLVMTSGGRTSPLTVGIASLVQPYEVAWGPMAAVGSLAAVPIIIMAVIANRQIVASLTAGAVKG